MNRSIFLAAVVLCLCMVSAAFGQTVTSRVSGTVKDAADAVVSGATVTLIDASSKENKVVTTNDEGVFSITDVRVGSYVLVVERTNFKKKQITGIDIHVDTPAVFNVVLEPGGVTETVSVTASEAQTLIRTEDAKLSTTIDVRQVQDLRSEEHTSELQSH